MAGVLLRGEGVWVAVGAGPQGPVPSKLGLHPRLCPQTWWAEKREALERGLRNPRALQRTCGVRCLPPRPARLCLELHQAQPALAGSRGRAQRMPASTWRSTAVSTAALGRALRAECGARAEGAWSWISSSGTGVEEVPPEMCVCSLRHVHSTCHPPLGDPPVCRVLAQPHPLGTCLSPGPSL